MKIHSTLFIIGLAFSQLATAQTPSFYNPESCTSIMVGREASADGSVMTSHTCDSWYRTWVNVVPAKTYDNDTVMNIYDGRMHTEYPEDQTNLTVKGTIPQARHTFAFLDTSYPCLNEKQLAMGETTISGRDTLRNEKGMFKIEELARVALERCSTARQAIRLMGELVKEYGYGDYGECLTIADPKEVWHFEVFGEGPDKVGGVWAAVRIPDGEVGVSANIPRISTLNLKDADNYKRIRCGTQAEAMGRQRAVQVLAGLRRAQLCRQMAVVQHPGVLCIKPAGPFAEPRHQCRRTSAQRQAGKEAECGRCHGSLAPDIRRHRMGCDPQSESDEKRPERPIQSSAPRPIRGCGRTKCRC